MAAAWRTGSAPCVYKGTGTAPDTLLWRFRRVGCGRTAAYVLTMPKSRCVKAVGILPEGRSAARSGGRRRSAAPLFERECCNRAVVGSGALCSSRTVSRPGTQEAGSCAGASAETTSRTTCEEAGRSCAGDDMDGSDVSAAACAPVQPRTTSTREVMARMSRRAPPRSSALVSCIRLSLHSGLTHPCRRSFRGTQRQLYVSTPMGLREVQWAQVPSSCLPHYWGGSAGHAGKH